MDQTLPDIEVDYTQSGLLDLTASADFGYGVFMQDQDVDYLAEDSANTLSEESPHLADGSRALTQRPRSDRGPGPSPGTSPGSGVMVQAPRQRLERRGHTKSRRGCYNCKRRRIKPQHQIPLFSLQDMRFFQHFLFKCYPHHPIGAENIWTHEIPCLSQKYEYLMHAILGYAASELMAEDASLATPAMTHRLKAIKAVKKSLAEAPKANTFEEGNALMATCFALTFQSVLLDDGLTEYMTFIRGIIIVAIQMYMKGAKMLFGDFLGDHGSQALQPHMEKAPLIEKSWTDGAVAAIRNLEPLCQGSDIEKTYYTMILDMAEKLYVSSWGAYQALGEHYKWWMMLPHDQFQRIIDPSNQTILLLSTHWIALKQIMASITEMEGAARAKEPEPTAENDMNVGLVKWLRYLNNLVDVDHVPYNVWPAWVEAQLERDPRCFGKGGLRKR
ncbi:hypothetical protein OQA88_11423 [Cercophora sp. LCS_1]